MLILLLIASLFPPVYLLGRYGTRWIEYDTSQAIRTSETLRSEDSIVNSEPYGNGFGHQVVSAFVADLTDLPVITLNTIAFPFLIGAVILAIIVLFRTIYSPSDPRALLAAALPLVQPDFIFTMLRGNHEKFTVLLAIAAIYLFLRSYSHMRRPATFAALIVLFYVSLFSLISMNVFFSSAFIIAMFLSLLGGRLLMARYQDFSEHRFSEALARITYIVAAGSVLVYLFFANFFPPARTLLFTLEDLYRRFTVLVLEVQPAVNPYSPIATGWRSTEVYVALTLFTWLFLAAAFLGWLAFARNALRSRANISFSRLIVWLLAAGFGLQAVLSIAVDAAGSLGNNFQLRILPIFAVVAAPFAADVMASVGAAVYRRPVLRPLGVAAVGIMFAWFATTAVLKGTAEPMLGNYWLLYSRTEERALIWFDSHERYAIIWTDFDLRLRELFDAKLRANSTRTNIVDGGDIDIASRHVLISDVNRARAARVKSALPSVAREELIYDAGSTSVYHLRPTTPYQR